METLRLTDIHHSPFGILHLIDSRGFGEILEYSLDFGKLLWQRSWRGGTTRLRILYLFHENIVAKTEKRANYLIYYK
jgi:hypothetical protein